MPISDHTASSLDYRNQREKVIWLETFFHNQVAIASRKQGVRESLNKASARSVASVMPIFFVNQQQI
ncbi:hypothetical protein [Cupriavidus sp. UYPR2.512]|uniref:hypothetical protein n=1 Tax=Cupriavidus sp. UYPR2.512 TaxID=1080187 RepID=UPI0003769A1C